MKLEKGINIGGYLSQCEHTDAHYESFINETDLETIAGWGFDHVRIPVDSEVLEDARGKRNAKGYDLLDKIAGWCARYGLDMVIDLHKAHGYDFNDAGNDEKNCLFTSRDLQKKFISLWEKIAQRFGKADHVAFEILNEIVEFSNIEPWNTLLDECISAIRSIAAGTALIYGGVQWNSPKCLKFLKKPKHENTVFSFHFYEPLAFTHQNAHWVPELMTGESIKYPETMKYYRNKSAVLGTRSEPVESSQRDNMGRGFIEDFLSEAIAVAKDMNVRLYCGEYGVINTAAPADTLRWLLDVNAVLEKNGIGGCYWNYKSKDFGLFDSHYDGIRADLLGDKPAGRG